MTWRSLDASTSKGSTYAHPVGTITCEAGAASAFFSFSFSFSSFSFFSFSSFSFFSFSSLSFFSFFSLSLHVLQQHGDGDLEHERDRPPQKDDPQPQPRQLPQRHRGRHFLTMAYLQSESEPQEHIGARKNSKRLGGMIAVESEENTCKTIEEDARSEDETPIREDNRKEQKEWRRTLSG